MQGKRQHVIPRFLLKGFQSKSEGRKIYCWVFPKEGKAYETNIINIAIEKEFYTQKNDAVVDKVITNAEQGFSILIKELRKIKNNSSIQDNRVPLFLAHLEIRTRHLRNFILKSGDILFNRFVDFLSSGTLIENILIRFSSNYQFIKSIVSKELKNRGLPKILEENLIEKFQASSNLMIRELEPPIRNLLRKLKKELPDLLPKWTKNAHIKSLTKSIHPETRVQNYNQLNYTLVVVDDDDLILGDNGVILEVDSQRRFKTFWEKENNVINVFLPISKNQILVGTKSPEISPISIKTIKETTASCSREFFVASKRTEQNEILQGVISERADLFTDEELNQIIDTWIADEIHKQVK